MATKRKPTPKPDPLPVHSLLLKDVRVHTDGKGLYTKVAKPIRIVAIRLIDYTEPEDKTAHGHLQVKFRPVDWDNEDNNVIYTDKLFRKELAAVLVGMGLSDDFDYSERGAQGETYVDFDVGHQFVMAFRAALKLLNHATLG